MAGSRRWAVVRCRGGAWCRPWRREMAAFRVGACVGHGGARMRRWVTTVGYLLWRCWGPAGVFLRWVAGLGAAVRAQPGGDARWRRERDERGGEWLRELFGTVTLNAFGPSAEKNSNESGQTELESLN
jgi:hypothetical protein